MNEAGPSGKRDPMPQAMAVVESRPLELL